MKPIIKMINWVEEFVKIKGYKRLDDTDIYDNKTFDELNFLSKGYAKKLLHLVEEEKDLAVDIDVKRDNIRNLHIELQLINSKILQKVHNNEIIK